MNIKTDRESVEALADELIGDSASCRLENRELGDRLQLAADTLTALLTEVQGWTDNAVFERGRANGFEAEVARLSTQPDDAEVAELVTRLRDYMPSLHHKAADALTRLSRALAAETAKREALAGLIEHAHNCERELTENLHHVDFCGESLPLTAARATPPDHLALVAAAYRDAADIADDDDGTRKQWGEDRNQKVADITAKEIMDAIRARTPADAEAHLTALLRAEYERGVREAAAACEDGKPYYICGGYEQARRILALLTQEGR